MKQLEEPESTNPKKVLGMRREDKGIQKVLGIVTKAALSHSFCHKWLLIDL